MKNLKFVFIAMTLLLFQCKNDADNAVPVNISILDLSIDEGNNYTNLTIQLELDEAAEQQITANISTNDGTAEANKDYIPFENQSIVFAAGETEKTYQITIAGDFILEDDEDFQITITHINGPATIDKATATININDDDNAGIQRIPISPILDWNAITNLAVWSEAPYEACNFGQPINVNNADYTSVGTLNDTISFESRTNTAGDTLLYLDVVFPSSSTWSSYLGLIAEPITAGDSVSLEILMPVINNETNNDVDFKYDLHMMIGTATGRTGPYTVDPKIRIPKSQ